MNIRQQEETLFKEWRAVRPAFVADGVVDESAYLASKTKLLFVLKEVNDPDGGNWDLREFMRSGGRPQTWNNVARWIEGIRNLSSEIAWKQLVPIDAQRRISALQSVAAMNLKKTPGGHPTNLEELNKVAAEDWQFLNRQFNLYDPDIVICCGRPARDTFHSLIDFGVEESWQMTSRGVMFHEFRPGKYVVSYDHPGALVADNILYYGLVDALREILGQ